ncbi:hypothetical protein IE53DRAFT_318313 [Violaceomyces palustris]|uniref:Uncharacterized protein n=1 Tax=Violaceomyces palustris TaxID=1673888 RepID=A0ACD0NTA9_9BASI|nr:hypothetical protein IE53DRAFT_318313 [Violaceomyces palustris]
MRSGPTSFSAPPPLPSSKSPSASSSASPSSSSPSKSGPIPSPTLGTDLTPERILSHFQQPPFPSQNVLGNDSEIATRAMTHESYKYGKEGQNRRLAFLGRRSLKLSLTLFLHTLSTSPKTSQSTKDWALKLLSDPPKVEEMITTQKLGDRIGRELGLEKVMRWTPALSDGQFGPKETGLFKVRGVCLEALLGAILHNSGADKARLFFNSKVLPSLVEQFFPEDTPTEAKELCETLANEAGESL